MTFVPHAKIPRYLGLADFAVTPVRPVPTKRYCTPIKDGEYWALGLPVVITANISDDSQIISETAIGAVLQDLNVDAYHTAVQQIDHLLHKPRKENYDAIRAIAKKYRSFEIAERVYSQVYHKIGSTS